VSEIGDVDDMAKNALRILKDEDTLNQFKQQAYQQALKFDIHNILPMYELLYDAVAGIKHFEKSS
jgi:glycosyltransferase involved in cell wall biosynthesis